MEFSSILIRTGGKDYIVNYENGVFTNLNMKDYVDNCLSGEIQHLEAIDNDGCQVFLGRISLVNAEHFINNIIKTDSDGNILSSIVHKQSG